MILPAAILYEVIRCPICRLLEALALTITLGTIVFGFVLIVWRERWVESHWRWLLELDERLRRPLEVLYVIVGIVVIALGALGLYNLATFAVTGMAHSIVGGSAWEPTPRQAVQRAGWDAPGRSRLPGVDP